MSADVFFTTKVAVGKTFCNRVKEREKLQNNIKKGQHTVVIAPRRYGKTSLVTYSLEEAELIYAKIDLFCVVYEKDICDKIAQAVSKILNRVLPFSEKTLHLIQNYFKGSSIGLKASQFELKIELNREQHDPSQQILNVLEGLEELAKKHKKKVVLFFDEFQDLLKADESLKIQAAIRTIAQASQFVIYIFSGSSRVMLKNIFENRKQPLYMLCSKINLDRISVPDLVAHVQMAAKHRWKKLLNEDVVQAIIACAECHPYYINFLCDKLFDEMNLPALEKVASCWDECLLEKKDKIIADLLPLNANRIKLLTQIALLGPIKEPNSRYFLEKTGLALGSVQKAITYLLDYDYIYKTEEGLSLVDPLMKKFIMERFSN